MADSSNGKKLIEIDVSSDTVCPWCFVGKTNLDRAIEKSKDSFDFKVLFFLSFYIYFFCGIHLEEVEFG
jgi:DSBA-like thioredoxin domain